MNQLDDTNTNKKENTASGGTIQFSIKKSKKIPGTPIHEPEDDREAAEEELLKNQSIPVEFEDVFSDEQIQHESTVSENVVGIDEVFKQKAEMINEDFHNETGEESEEENPHLPGLKKAAIIIGIVSGAIILAAVAIALIVII